MIDPSTVQKGDCYLLSIKHTSKKDRYITFWRPDNCGYCYPLSWAGKYSEAEVRADPKYYHNHECTVAVPVDAVEALAITTPEKGVIDGDVGPVVQNTKENMRRLRNAAIQFDLEVE